MDLLSRPEVILTHESDLDGFVAGHLLQRLARRLFDTDVRLEAWNTHAWRQRAPKEKAAWVCDMAFEARLDRPGWMVVDHHPTAMVPTAAKLVHDAGQSAAKLCYGLCQAQGLGSPALDRLVLLTDIGDLFLEDHPEFDLAQDYGSLVKQYSFWSLSRLLGGEIERLLDHPLLEVVQTRRRIEDPIGLAWSRSRVARISATVGWVDTVVGNTNLIVHQLLRDPGCPYAVLITLSRKASTGVVVSLRSRNGEALAIARRLQGGGHPNACGAILPRAVQSVAEGADYLRRLLDPPPAGPGALGAESAGLQL